jgi:hypothetical protein
MLAGCDAGIQCQSLILCNSNMHLFIGAAQVLSYMQEIYMHVVRIEDVGLHMVGLGYIGHQ